MKEGQGLAIAQCTASAFVTGYPAGDNTGFCSQPGFGNISGTVTDTQLANAYSGVGSCAAHNFANSLSRNAAPSCAQPACGDLSNSGNGCQASDTTGTWTPTITSTGGGSATYNNQIGNYTTHTTASGQTWVTAQCYVNWATTSGLSGSLEVAGLPFASINVANTFWLVALGQYGGLTLGANYLTVAASLGPNSTTPLIFESGTGVAGQALPISGVAGAGVILFTIIYRSA